MFTSVAQSNDNGDGDTFFAMLVAKTVQSRAESHANRSRKVHTLTENARTRAESELSKPDSTQRQVEACTNFGRPTTDIPDYLKFPWERSVDEMRLLTMSPWERGVAERRLRRKERELKQSAAQQLPECDHVDSSSEVFHQEKAEDSERPLARLTKPRRSLPGLFSMPGYLRFTKRESFPRSMRSRLQSQQQPKQLAPNQSVPWPEQPGRQPSPSPLLRMWRQQSMQQKPECEQQQPLRKASFAQRCQSWPDNLQQPSSDCPVDNAQSERRSFVANLKHRRSKQKAQQPCAFSQSPMEVTEQGVPANTQGQFFRLWMTDRWQRRLKDPVVPLKPGVHLHSTEHVENLEAKMEQRLAQTRNLDFSSRQKVFRELQRSLHPDKNHDCPEVAKQAFCRLMDMRSSYLDK